MSLDRPSKRGEGQDNLSRSYRVKKKSQRQEVRVAKLLSGRVTPGSGSFAGHKGDIVHDRFLIEAKRTDKDSLSIKNSWLGKIEAEAFQAGRYPALSIQIGSRSQCLGGEADWVMIPLSVLITLLEGCNA